MTRLCAITVVLACATLTWASSASAEEGYPRVWINPGFYSYHFDQDVDLRENNLGLGTEVEIKRRHVLTAGIFHNSDDEKSRYLGYQWRPLNWTPGNTEIDLGLIVAALDGYPRVDNGGWFATLLPVLSIQWKRLGVNFTVVPEIKDQVYGAVAVQFKLRVW